MAGHADLVPDVADDAFVIDKEGRAFNTHIGAAVHALFDPNAIDFTDLAAFIGCQRKIQIIFFGELLMTGDAVFGNADDRQT